MFRKPWFVVLLVLLPTVASGHNYPEALQKAIYFYESQQAGPLPSWNRVAWRGDATMNDAVLGGLYDAGDHVKFNLPMSYTASMLGWALYEYEQGFKDAGQEIHIKNNIRFILSYLLECWNGNSYVYQVGHGGNDHSWWGPVEVIHKENSAGNRPVLSTESGASCVMAQTSAALSLGYINFGDSVYLTAAKQLFDRAYNDGQPSDSVYKASDAAGYYNSWSGPWDEIMWSAVWLYLATEDDAYLSIAESTLTKLNKQGQTENLEYKWGHVWDDSHYGAMLMLAKITDKQIYQDFVNMHLDWWTSGFGGERITYTPGGLAWLDTWGSLRYSTTTAFLAFVYSDWLSAGERKTRYRQFAEDQINYALGDNPRNGSYVIGYGNAFPEHPHHRTAHGSWADSQQIPANHRHVLHGALVGGPNQSDAYSDKISDYIANEVACDYNAGFVGALAKLSDMYGGQPDANFPPPETKHDEFFVEAQIQGSQNEILDVKVLTNNRSAWPTRTIKDLSWRYYLDISELVAAGYGPGDVSASTHYKEFPGTLSELKHVSGNIYYVEMAYTDGSDIYPGGQSEFAGEVQLRLAAPNNSGAWDPTNDPSYKCLSDQMAKAECILLFDGATRIWGDIEGDNPPVLPSAPKNFSVVN